MRISIIRVITEILTWHFHNFSYISTGGDFMRTSIPKVNIHDMGNPWYYTVWFKSKRPIPISLIMYTSINHHYWNILIQIAFVCDACIFFTLIFVQWFNLYIVHRCTTEKLNWIYWDMIDHPPHWDLHTEPNDSHICRHFRMYFLEWRYVNCDYNFTEVCS